MDKRLQLKYANYEMCTQGVKTAYRVCVREVLAQWGASPLVKIRPYKNNVRWVATGLCLYEVFNVDRLRFVLAGMEKGTGMSPVQVTKYKIGKLAYYIVGDGNHRAAASCILKRNTIEAEILGVVDLTYAPINIDTRTKELVLACNNELTEWSLTHYILSGMELKAAVALGQLQRNVQNGKEKVSRNKTRNRQKQMAG